MQSLLIRLSTQLEIRFLRRHGNHSATANWRRLIIPADAPSERMTNREIKDYIEKSLLGNTKVSLFDKKAVIESRMELQNLIPKPGGFLTPRKMTDSFLQCYIPLKNDIQSRTKFMADKSNVRIGRILEEIDFFAVAICCKHQELSRDEKTGRLPYMPLTLMVDRMDATRRKLSPYEDIRLSGHVTWAGSSTIEVTVLVEQEDDGEWVEAMKVICVMIVRGPVGLTPGFAHPILVETEKEKELFEFGAFNYDVRMLIAEESLFKTTPTEEELELIHGFFHKIIESRKTPGRWMDTTVLKHMSTCQPEHKHNIHIINGGYILRKAMELAWTTAFVYAKVRPRVIHMDDTVFKEPVMVGDLLDMQGQVTYTEGNRLQITVFAEVIHPEKGQRKLTNVFHYTFEVEELEAVEQIVPKTYKEAMMYLQGRRHYVNSTRQHEHFK